MTDKTYHIQFLHQNVYLIFCTHLVRSLHSAFSIVLSILKVDFVLYGWVFSLWSLSSFAVLNVFFSIFFRWFFFKEFSFDSVFLYCSTDIQPLPLNCYGLSWLLFGLSISIVECGIFVCEFWGSYNHFKNIEYFFFQMNCTEIDIRSIL